MEFRILGSLEVVEQGLELAPGRRKRRALLAVLLLRANEPVPVEVLADALWEGAPPLTAAKAVHGHVSALRKLLGAERIETRAGGYLLRLQPGELDLERFEALLAAARRVAGAEERATRLGEALELWRGEPLADFRYDGFARWEIARLEELRLVALEERVEAELACGRDLRLLPELEQLVAAHPLRERLRAQQMLALYRAGRQAEALHAFQEGRRLLAEEVGIDPGPALQVLQGRILEQDPALELPKPAAAPLRQERKRITVLVVELSGPSDPEELDRLLEPALARARELLAGFGASVQPLFSNALIGIFGAPRAYEDDVERAVRAAAAVVDVPREDGLLVRVGVDRGEALVTIEGDRGEVTGDVLAAASRLQAAAPPNGVALGDAVERARRTSEGLEAPFVGRLHELGLLEQTYDRVVADDAVQLVTIAGEPGSGKTRLAAELRTLVERKQPQGWLAGRCLPYGDGVTFWALGEIVKGAAGILESDDLDTSAHKLAAALAALLPESDRAWVEASLSPLVGLSGAGSATRGQSFAAWRRFLESLAMREPLVLLVEDLHWADQALVEFVDELVDRAAGVPLLVLCTARLELLDRQPRWAGGKRNATTITLPPLSAEETRALARALLGGEEPSEAVIARAGGNPLFAHELARMQASETGSLPESLQAVIAARLDTLAPAAKQTAMDAAVVGEVFWPGAVAAISGLDEAQVDERLLQLATGEFVRPARVSSVAGQRQHAFLHVLVRDVAYAQIPRAQRARKHQAAAAWIEQLAGERVIDHAELIAHHYVAALQHASDDAELAAKTRRSLTLAGDRAMRLNLVVAERFYRRALALVPEGDPERGHLLAQIARAASEAGRLADGERLYDQAVVALRAGEDARALGGALTDLYRAVWRRGAGREARSVLAEAVRVLEREPPGQELAAAYVQMTHAHTLSGRSRRAVRWADRAIALADQLGLQHHVVQALTHRGLARCGLNDLGGANDLREALRLGLEAAGGYETAIAYNLLAEWTALTDGPESALELYTEGIEFAERRGFDRQAYWLRVEKLEHLFALGRWDELLGLADELLNWDRTRGASRFTAIAVAHKAGVLVRRGAVAEAKSLVDALLEPARKIADQEVLTLALACAAVVERASGDDGAAIDRVEELEKSTRGRVSMFAAR
jgi:DNA-binding SARP family transcriptional activator